MTPTLARLAFALAAAAPAPDAPPVPRLLLGLGAQLGAASGEPGAASAAGGLYGRVGEQFARAFGFELELSLGEGADPAWVRAALTAEYAPLPWLRLAVGPAVREDPTISNGGDQLVSAGGTVRLDFVPYRDEAASGRDAFVIGLVVDLGVAFGNFSYTSERGFPSAWAGYVTFGWARD